MVIYEVNPPPEGIFVPWRDYEYTYRHRFGGLGKIIFSYAEQTFRDLFNDKNKLTSMIISACISNYIGVSQWDIITYSCHNGIGGLAKRLWSQACVSNYMTQTLLCQQNHVNKRDPRQSRHPEDRWRGALMIYLFTHFCQGIWLWFKMCNLQTQRGE